jgi:fatty-acyl-CoA synthase
VTYHDLEERVGTLAGCLRQASVTTGDRVAYLGPSCTELLEALCACGRLGAILVPLNARMPAAELEVFVAHTAPRIFLAEESFETAARACTGSCPNTRILSFRAGGTVCRRADGHPVSADPHADPTAPVVILFTSGTTGSPKGAVMASDALLANAADTTSALEMTARDEVLTFTPMFHVAGLNLLTTPALSVGATVTVHPRFCAETILHDIAAIPATLLVASPPMTLELAADPAWERTDLTGLRCVVTGGTAVTERSITPWRERGVPVVQSYGLTEAGPHVTLVPLHDVPRMSLTAGRPTLQNQVRVIDASGRHVDRGARGEIVVQGPSVMQGYWENSEATRETLRDGWCRTGDVGFIDAAGYLHVVDRIKEIIVVGVSNVYPADLEAVLNDSPDIDAAAVVARPDDKLGEVPVAFVVPAPGHALSPDGVLSRFDGRLAPYKHPRDVVILDAMPRTSVGKPNRKALRAIARARCAAPPDGPRDQ